MKPLKNSLRALKREGFHMKKVLVLLMAAAMVLSMAACKENTTKKSAGVMTYAQYVEAALDSEVTVECYVQDHQSWWDNKITVYAMDGDGGYFLYNMACTEEDAAKLVPGTKIKVKGFKSQWAGEVEITDGTFEIEKGKFIASAKDVTSAFGTDKFMDYANQFIALKGLTIEASKDADGKEVPFLYNWDGSGEPGSDLYFNVSLNGTTYNFTVESYLRGKDTDVYKAVEGLKVGDKIDLEGFLYVYEGPQAHVTKVTVK